MLTLERIHEIAADAARHVCEGGSPAADKHNTKTIEHAIQLAITEHTNGKPEPQTPEDSRNHRTVSSDKTETLP